jgi:hypothetical protein
MNSIYHKKYLKYKNKYLELKNQIGGTEFILDSSGNRCAEVTNKNDDKELFITDIKVHRDFANCKSNFATILNQIEEKAKTEGKIVTLEDNSFMQFPEKYNSDSAAPYKWDLAFVKNGGLSLYETFGFSLNLTKDTDKERNFLQKIRDLTIAYNRTNSFNLLNEGKKLEISRRVLAGEIVCTDATKCYTNRDDYNVALRTFDTEYKNFDRHLYTGLLTYIGTPGIGWTINVNEDMSYLQDVSPVKSYHSLIKRFNLNMYKKTV